jgi:hypothetical protein
LHRPPAYFAGFLRNNTPIYTAQGVEVVPFADGCMTEGKLMLHDSCIDKPTADNFTCEEQRAFGKCDFPFMVVSAAAALPNDSQHLENADWLLVCALFEYDI